MPLYDFSCKQCGVKVERFLPIDTPPVQCESCGEGMSRGAGSLSFIRVKGQGFPSRRKWMDNWTPDSPKFSTGSLHGERY